MQSSTWLWVTRQWSRVRGWFGAFTLPVVVVVTVVAMTGKPRARTGLKHFSHRAGCSMTHGGHKR